MDGHCTKRRVVAVVRFGSSLRGIAQCSTEEVNGVALEAEPDVGVDGGGDPDVSVAEEFFDHDELDALLQEERGGGVS